jgi:uncharacterized protein YyaL (SSP411 family)
MEFLLRYWKRTGKDRALEMVEKTSRQMADGGIYDQLGGGFHRYSVDAVWLVPHFEKMLYDNAQLIRVYLHLYQITKDEVFKRISVETLGYIKREMLDERGGFYSTQDADSEGEEGKFFVWTPGEIEKILGEGDAQVFNFFYDVSDDGNFEGKNILNVKFTVESAARALNKDLDDVEAILYKSRQKLFAEREKRVKPHRDEKIITAWNGLMLAAFAEAAAILQDNEYLTVARNGADFLLAELQRDGRLLRTWKDGRSKLDAYVEDYANLADGLLELYQASGEARYLNESKRLTDVMIDEFWDKENGGFFFTSHDHESLIVRNKDLTDNATPSGNSAASDVLLKLSKIISDESYERFATKILSISAKQAERYPQGFGRALSVMEFSIAPTKEIVIVADDEGKLMANVYDQYLPNKVVVNGRTQGGHSQSLPLLDGRTAIDGKPTVYVCEEMVCQKPVTEEAELKEILSN